MLRPRTRTNKALEAIKWQAYNVVMARKHFDNEASAVERENELRGMRKMAELVGVDDIDLSGSERDGRAMAEQVIRMIGEERAAASAA